MRFLHSADWHLGRSFLGLSLIDDQAHVLEQLVEVAVERNVDAVLLAGDIYDRSAPSSDAVSLLDETLTRLVLEHRIAVIVIAGNHDSGERLAFGSRLLSARGLHVAGLAPLVVTLDDEHGPVDIVAIPFCEPSAAAGRSGDDAIADHDAALRAEISWASRLPVHRNGASGRRKVALAHAFVAGGHSSESERPLVLGNAALVRSDCFDSFAYAALGHLHRPQPVGRRECRYSGSLLKYSFDEAAHRKSISLVTIGAGGACDVEEVSLSARRDVRVLEGTLDELRRAAAADSARDDYVMVRLTDRGAVLDSIGKLRAIYPNCLRVDHSAFFRAEPGARQAVDLRRQDEEEMFEAFFVEVTGERASEEEQHAFRDAVAAVRRSS